MPDTRDRLAADIRENVAYWEDRIAQSPEDAYVWADAILAAIASPSEEPGLDVERLALLQEAFDRGWIKGPGTKTTLVDDRWNAWLAEYARLAKEPGS